MHHPVGVDIDDLGDGEGVVVPGDDERPLLDPRRIGRLVEQRPRQAAVVRFPVGLGRFELPTS
ncbi:MAG TPA: hypothetical protein VM263_00835 [Acidimicrobiales bacterium]|nr:hypothetical protein [Acidimicrobiales bacterium]